jgi:O-antigen ligase
MGIINYILFFILTIIGLYYLFNQKQIRLKSVIHKDKYFLVDNYQYLFLFILTTTILASGNTMANRLLVTIIFSLLAIVLTKQNLLLSITGLFYIIYLLWLVIAIFYSPVKIYGFRVFLKYLYPFLIMLFASKITNSPEFYRKVLQIILYVGFYGVCFFLFIRRLPFVGNLFGDITFWGPAILDFFPVTITICLVFYSYSKQRKYLIFTALIIIPSIFTSNRTGLLAASITIVVFAIVRYKIKSLPYVILGLGVFIGTLLYVSDFRDKMFKKQLSSEEIIERGEELTIDDIDSSGRFAMWEWSFAHFYKGKKWKGSGLGVLQHAFYTWDHPFGGLRVVHNDYVQILCDTGLIGLVLYALTVFSLIIHSFIIYYTKRKVPLVRIAAIISGVSLAGMLSTLYTDNVVNYSLMTLGFPFALYGMMIGLNQKYKINN